jgi:acid phosphatase family membrane protein YuiD
MAYVVVPFVAWIVAGSLKFLVNCVAQRRLAFDLIGYGGFPSTHTSVAAAAAALIGIRSGFDTPAFCVAVTCAYLVVIDALSLRRRIGRHAEQINALMAGRPDYKKLRERMGHKPFEVFGGVCVGACVGVALHYCC